MSTPPSPAAVPVFPFIVQLENSTVRPNNFLYANREIHFNSEIITLVGPNGTGKTSLMKVLRDKLRNDYGTQKIRYVSAGRMGVLEYFRSDNQGTGPGNPNDTYTGSHSNIEVRKLSETVTGDFLTIDVRSDIRLKIEARLQGIFGKTLILKWSQNGLQINFKSIVPGSGTYGAGVEASGLTQLIALLAALYDDEIKILLIDEPEVSLHPQLQSFILKEIRNVAGHPSTPGKKIVVISTHSPSMLPIKTASDLPSVVFFNDLAAQPLQIAPGDAILNDPHITGLMVRLNELYKIAFFASSILLSEGISEEIVVGSVADRIDDNFHSAGNQIVSVGSKGELHLADKLFLMMGKKTSILGDLDVLDDNILIRYIDSKGLTGLNHPGYADLTALYTNADTDLTVLINTSWGEIATLASTHPYYTGNGAWLTRRKRAGLAFLLSANTTTLTALPHGTDWKRVKGLFELLLDNMDTARVTLIRKGTIEDCYISSGVLAGLKKPAKAAYESAHLVSASLPGIKASYTDVIKALEIIRQKPKVDEPSLLRARLGAFLGLVTANISASTTDQEIQQMLNNFDEGLSKIFSVTLTTVGGMPHYVITWISTLFSGYTSPIQISTRGTLTELQRLIPS